MEGLKGKIIKNIVDKVEGMANNNVDVDFNTYSPFFLGDEISLEDNEDEEKVNQ